MLRRSLPSHGGTETSGTWLPIGVGSGVGLGVAFGTRVRGFRGLGGGGRIAGAFPLVLTDEDAAARQRIEREHVVAGDHDVAARHDQHDGEQAGDRQGIARQARLAQPPAAGHGVRVEVLRDAIRIDDRDQAVEQRNEVEDEDRAQQERAEQQPDELEPVHPQHEAGEERERAARARRRTRGPACRRPA